MNDVGLGSSSVADGFPSMAVHVVLCVHKASLYPKAHPRVVLDALAVEKIGQCAFDPLGKIKQLVLGCLVVRLFKYARYTWAPLGELV